MSKPKALALKDVSFNYDRRAHVIDAITLEMTEGERVAILGESGSGKSTLVGLLSGLLMPTRGHVFLAGEDISDIPFHERNIALVLQRPPLLIGTTVHELLSRPAKRNRPLPTANAGQRPAFEPKGIGDVLDILGMRQLEYRRLTDLSGGELQRVHIARSLVWKPDFMLFDEPFNSIDVHLKHSLYPIIRQHQARCESCMILVTHDPLEALLLCDRIVIMRGGIVIADSRADELLGAPPNVSSAQLIGGFATNVIEVQLKRGPGSELALDTFLGTYGGSFEPHGGGLELPERAKAVFRWTDIVGQPISNEHPGLSLVFTAANGGSASPGNPALYMHELLSVYGRPLGTTDQKAALGLAAASVLLYDAQTELLAGRFVFCRATNGQGGRN